MSSDIVARNPIQAHGIIGQQDLAEFGSMLGDLGYNREQTRGVIAALQQLGNQAALAAGSTMIEQMQRHVERRMKNLINEVQMLQSFGGYVRRADVFMAIQRASLANTLEG